MLHRNNFSLQLLTFLVFEFHCLDYCIMKTGAAFIDSLMSQKYRKDTKQIPFKKKYHYSLIGNQELDWKIRALAWCIWNRSVTDAVEPQISVISSHHKLVYATCVWACHLQHSTLASIPYSELLINFLCLS